MSDLPGLLERVIKCEGPDRKLDVAIYEALWPPFVLEGSAILGPSGELIKDAELFTYQHPTASIDAALGLVERVLPGWFPLVGKDHRDFLREGEPDWSATILGPCRWTKDRESGCDEPNIEDYVARSDTPPLAILAALLSALIANPDFARVKV